VPAGVGAGVGTILYFEGAVITTSVLATISAAPLVTIGFGVYVGALSTKLIIDGISYFSYMY
jgi:hypothetical protein